MTPLSISIAIAELPPQTNLRVLSEAPTEVILVLLWRSKLMFHVIQESKPCQALYFADLFLHVIQSLLTLGHHCLET